MVACEANRQSFVSESSGQSFVAAAAAAQAYLDLEEEEKHPAAPMERRGSVKKDKYRNLSVGPLAEIKGVSKIANGSASPSAPVDTKDKGKAKEKEKEKEKSSKLKRKKTGTSVEKEVVYYTAKHGMPMPPPSPPADTANGAPSGVGSSTTRSFSPPLPPPQLPPKPPGRNGFTHVPQPSIMMNVRAFMDDEDESLGRLSAVTEREEPNESPTQRTSVNQLLTPANIANITNEPHTSSVFNAFASLRPTSNNAPPIEMVRRRSRSVGEHDDDDEKPRPPRQSSVMSWADDYKDILAKSRGRAMASGVSLLSSPSEQSFAYRSAVPVASGELPSNGTPGHVPLHLARAPPPMMSPSSPTPGLLGGLKNAVSGSTPGGVMSPNGKVDLTRSGMAQTTMASIEVIKGLGSVKRGLSGVFSQLGRRRTVSGGEGMDLLQNRRPANRLRKGSADVGSTQGSQGPNAGKYTSGTSVDRVLGFTAHRIPPTYVPSGSVLVQVWAVGVDGTDAKLVGLRLGRRKPWLEPEEEEAEMRGRAENAEDGEGGKRGAPRRSLSLRQRLGSLSRRRGSVSKKDGVDEFDKGKGKARSKDRDRHLPPIPHADVGFIPGRSFVGRVLDCGWDVKDEQVRKGDFVAGLLDVRRVSVPIYMCIDC